MLDCGRLSPCISKLVATTATVPKQRKKANRIALARNKHGLKLGTTRELDCIESIILREIYLMAIQKTSTKLDCLFYEINELPVEDSHCVVFRAELWESLLETYGLLLAPGALRGAAEPGWFLCCVNGRDEEALLVGMDRLRTQLLQRKFLHGRW